MIDIFFKSKVILEKLWNIEKRLNQLDEKVMNIEDNFVFVEEKVQDVQESIHNVQNYVCGFKADASNDFDKLHSQINIENRIRLREIIDFSEYLIWLKNLKNELIIMAIRDTPGYCFCNKHDELLHKLGLSQTLTQMHWHGYIAVIDKGRIVDERLGELNEDVEILLQLDDINIKVKSAPLKASNCAEIVINHMNYSLNKRGVNIVVYDIENEYIIDSVAFDTHSSNCICSRSSTSNMLELLNETKRYIEDANRTNNLIHTKIEGLEFHNNQRVLEVRAREKVINEKKLKVFFVTSYASKFGLKSVYKAMEKSSIFDPYVFVVHSRDLNLHKFVEYQKELRNTYNLFVNKGYKTILGYDEKLRPIGLEHFMPDVVFLSFQNLFLSSFYKNIIMNYNFLTCYVPYGACIVNNFLYHYENYHVNTSWRVFSETFFSYMQGVSKTSHNGINYVLTGYPKLDEYGSQMQPNKEKNIRKKVIIAPHWSIRTGERDQNMAVFHLYYKYFMNLLSEFEDIDFYFKPHPDLRYRLQKLQKEQKDVGMTLEEYDNYVESWNCHKNGYVVPEGDYIELFRESDCLITDCGSFIAEYLPSGNPCIYMLNPERKNAANLSHHFNELGVKILNTYYLCKSWEDVYKYFIEVVIQNNDSMRQKRKALVDSEFVNLGSAGQFIVDYLTRVFSE